MNLFSDFLLDMCNLVQLPGLPEHKYTNFITIPASDTNTTHAFVWYTDYLRCIHNQNNCIISTNAQFRWKFQECHKVQI